MSHRIITAALTFVVAVAFASTALGHGAEPLPENIHGFDSGEWVFHTNFGVITSDAPTRYVCEEAFSGGDQFRVAAIALNQWVIFTPDAIYRTEDGCDFEKVAPLPKISSDVGFVRGGEGVAYVVNAQNSDETGVFVSRNAGASFRKVAVDVAGRQFTRVEFLNADTLLVSAYAKDSSSQGAAELIEVSLTGDAVTMLEPPQGLRYPYLLDVEAESIVWQASTDDGQSLFWGTVDDPGRDGFALEAWPNGAVLSADGSEFWVAAANSGSKGLTHAMASDMMIDIAAEHSGLCVGRAGDAIYACARGDREGHELSRVIDGELDAAVSFDAIEGPRVSCPAGSDVASTCPAVWPELARGLGVEVGNDASGAGDTGSDDEGSACSAGGAGAPVGLHVFLMLLGLVAVSRRRG